MKTLLAFLMITCGAANADVLATDITNMDMIDLNVESSSLSLALQYPGPNISGLCGVEIRANSQGRDKLIHNLLYGVTITNDLGVNPIISIKNDMTILIDLSEASGTYTTQFSIKTFDGVSLKEAIRKTLGENRIVKLVGVTCS